MSPEALHSQLFSRGRRRLSVSIYHRSQNCTKIIFLNRSHVTSMCNTDSKSYLKYKHFGTNIHIFRCFFSHKLHSDALDGSPGHTSHVTSKCNADSEWHFKFKDFDTITMYFGLTFSL